MEEDGKLKLRMTRGPSVRQVLESDVLISSISDHDLVYLKLCLKREESPPFFTTSLPPNPFKILRLHLGQSLIPSTTPTTNCLCLTYYSTMYSESINTHQLKPSVYEAVQTLMQTRRFEHFCEPGMNGRQPLKGRRTHLRGQLI